jgi:parallel beta-helix repeat protein
VGAAIAGSPDNTTIANNSFVNNNSALYVAKASGNIVFNNVISGTSEAAIAFVKSGATLSSNNQVYSNTVHDSLSEGILFDLGFQNTISANVIGCASETVHSQI